LFGYPESSKFKAMQTNTNIAFDCTYHVVWCPKYRRPVLVGRLDVRLKEVLRETCAGVGAEVLEVEVMPDPVHLLVSVDPQFGITRLVRSMKGRSSRILREEFPDVKRRMRTLWTNSCYIGTVGGASLETVRAYVENQKVA
jgi:putative transposase